MNHQFDFAINGKSVPAFTLSNHDIPPGDSRLFPLEVLLRLLWNKAEIPELARLIGVSASTLEKRRSSLIATLRDLAEQVPHDILDGYKVVRGSESGEFHPKLMSLALVHFLHSGNLDFTSKSLSFPKAHIAIAWSFLISILRRAAIRERWHFKKVYGLICRLEKTLRSTDVYFEGLASVVADIRNEKEHALLVFGQEIVIHAPAEVA